MTDLVALERSADVGGTWRDNRYPGCACDVPAALYSFSFELSPSWSRSFSGQQEIRDYLRCCAQRYAVAPRIPGGKCSTPRAGTGPMTFATGG
jgi:cation diffusion facilitator CzcD-associated flavoprotein CzcO